MNAETTTTPDLGLPDGRTLRDAPVRIGTDRRTVRCLACGRTETLPDHAHPGQLARFTRKLALFRSEHLNCGGDHGPAH